MKPRYRYVGTPLTLTEREAYHLQKYWKKGRKSGAIEAWAGYDLDLPALNTPVQLDCRHCHRAHHESCCEGGYPFPPAVRQVPLLEQHLPVIAARHLPDEKREQIRQNGLWQQHAETEGLPTIATHEGNCLLCAVEGTGPACAAHRYALEEGLAPEQMKPFSCSLFPLELITGEDGRVLVTALTAETARFSRWGSLYLDDFVCANLPLRLQAERTPRAAEISPNVRRELAADAFAPERYRPAWQEMKEILCNTFGETLWQQIEAACLRD
ncbi:uncharacterized protein DUF3109 [Tumebacillus sp. BK434]|uniref:DUF3109 family protein n=1 Tax=Tumebacillus sp. BK434 TaxID=2512169 RepID=UPI001051C0BC|nr:DUF3109 family protein [Tumebacillus sp. BK434]TCP55587.1 uncharacterized protein DUF3109 [Tumebacillus sp. BK434]